MSGNAKNGIEKPNKPFHEQLSLDIHQGNTFAVRYESGERVSMLAHPFLERPGKRPTT
jgi:hypothetical protein